MVTHIGNYKGKVQCADGTENIIIMKNVKVVPGLVKNLISLSTVMHNNWDFLTETTDDTKVLKIKKNDVEYKFDILVRRSYTHEVQYVFKTEIRSEGKCCPIS